MKLEVKRIPEGNLHPFALYVDGEIVPGQVKVEILNTPDDISYVVVTFNAHPASDITIVGDEPKQRHDAVRQGDEYFCASCGKRWGIDEQPPECE